ncbi:hypothetical protein DSO57_1022478 [Entomophthora muscae]|uniref:Uncharacterized protein n=1 Tax=Entomophthora muscae TaxID=34485 RepID=A0ACC2SSS7_9FUNG|nr:hypothetical protein DSO57_1022478 [Entomophthora muscae]
MDISIFTKGWVDLHQVMLHDNNTAFVGKWIHDGPQQGQVIVKTFEKGSALHNHPYKLGFWWHGAKNLTRACICPSKQLCTFKIALNHESGKYHYAAKKEDKYIVRLDTFYFKKLGQKLQIDYSFMGPSSRTIYFNKLGMAAEKCKTPAMSITRLKTNECRETTTQVLGYTSIEGLIGALSN